MHQGEQSCGGPGREREREREYIRQELVGGLVGVFFPCVLLLYLNGRLEPVMSNQKRVLRTTWISKYVHTR